jgi:hypothetical protein
MEVGFISFSSVCQLFRALPKPPGSQMLFPYYHKAYWMGLQSNDGMYPRFKWMDYNTPAPGPRGTYQASGRTPVRLSHPALPASGTCALVACQLWKQAVDA